MTLAKKDFLVRENKDYYQILNIAADAEAIVIKAAYIALIKFYHPDAATGDEQKAKEINEAYGVLRDPIKRKEYDNTRTAQDEINSAFYDKYEHIEPLKEEWKIACDFCPDLIGCHERLSAISYELGFQFKLLILEEKQFKSSKSLSENLRVNYLSRYFGDNQELQSFAESLILAKERKALLEVNKVVKVLGNEATISNVKERIYAKFPQIELNLHKQKLIYQISRGDMGNGYFYVYLNSIGAEIYIKSYPVTEIEITINGETRAYKSNLEAAKYILNIS
jgi:curved DNA-binding protein CbpA